MKLCNFVIMVGFIFFMGIHSVYGQGAEAFLSAAFTGKLETINSYLENGGDVNVTDEKGCSALFLATNLDSVEVIKILLDHGANINVQTHTTKQTPLINAAYVGNLEVVKLLVEKGADINIKDMAGETALDAAKINKNNDVVMFLMMQKTDDPKKKDRIKERMKRRQRTK